MPDDVISLKYHFRANASIQNGRLDITLSPKRLCSSKPVEQVFVTSQLPSNVTNLNLTASTGSYTFNNVDKILKWDVSFVEFQIFFQEFWQNF